MYSGKAKPHARAIALFKRGDCIPVCPEQLGGLSTPRVPSEVEHGRGDLVLDKKAKVVNRKGRDVTDNFCRGAKEAYRVAKSVGATEFVGKSKSPSCGVGRTYDGTFSNTLVEGDGVTAAYFKRRGIHVITENELDE